MRASPPLIDFQFHSLVVSLSDMSCMPVIWHLKGYLLSETFVGRKFRGCQKSRNFFIIAELYFAVGQVINFPGIKFSGWQKSGYFLRILIGDWRLGLPFFSIFTGEKCLFTISRCETAKFSSRESF